MRKATVTNIITGETKALGAINWATGGLHYLARMILRTGGVLSLEQDHEQVLRFDYQNSHGRWGSVEVAKDGLSIVATFEGMPKSGEVLPSMGTGEAAYFVGESINSTTAGEAEAPEMPEGTALVAERDDISLEEIQFCDHTGEDEYITDSYSGTVGVRIGKVGVVAVLVYGNSEEAHAEYPNYGEMLWDEASEPVQELAEHTTEASELLQRLGIENSYRYLKENGTKCSQ